jgi:hypothetical protein
MPPIFLSSGRENKKNLETPLRLWGFVRVLLVAMRVRERELCNMDVCDGCSAFGCYWQWFLRLRVIQACAMVLSSAGLLSGALANGQGAFPPVADFYLVGHMRQAERSGPPLVAVARIGVRRVVKVRG